LDEARRALIAAIPERPSTSDFGVGPLSGRVDGDDFSVVWTLGDSDDEGWIVRGRLRAQGDRVRVHALLSTKGTPIDWRVSVPIAALSLGASWVLWPDPWPWDELPGLILLAGVACLASLIPRGPGAPPRLVVEQVKEFLSHALLAEPIEVTAKPRKDA